MSVELEWEMSADSVDLPPLRTSSTPFRPNSTSSSSWRPITSTSTLRAETPLFRAETPLLRSGSPAGRVAVSRIDHCQMEGELLNLPSEEEATEARRRSSPRGMAAYIVGRGVYGSVGEEAWKIKRRHLRPLVPIEETLRKRRVMQTSMSAPALFPEMQAPPTPNTLQSSQYSRASSRHGKGKSQELTDASMQSSWACSEGRSLVESCMRLCTWEDSLAGGGAQSSWSHLPSGVKPSSASPSAPSIRVIGASSWSPGKMPSPSKVSLRQKPLPSELLLRMKDHGWTQTDLGSTVWVEQGRRLAASRSQPPAATSCRAMQERLQLLQFLEQQAVPQGPKALRAALTWRCNTLEQAYRCLDVTDRQGRGGLSLLEFSGALALLGLDAPSLCGSEETEVFGLLDADMDGRLSMYDLLGTSAAAPSWCDRGSRGYRSVEKGGADRWVFVIKFVALSAWFATPVLLRRKLRPQLGTAESAVSLHVERPETPAGGAFSLVTAVAEGANGIISHGEVARQQVSDPVRQSWSPSENDLDDMETRMKEEFDKYATAKQFAEFLMKKSDFFRFLGDIPPVGIGDDPEPQQLTHVQLGDIFEEVLAMQMESTAFNGLAFSKGLTFDSFRLALLKASLIMGLHFRHVVDDAVDIVAASFKG